MVEQISLANFGADIAMPYSKEYWDGLADGRIRLQRCSACGRWQNFPQVHCRHCLGKELTWIDAAGTGTLHTYTTVHRAPSAEFAEDAPYVIGIVRLPEGVQLLARILVDTEDVLDIDMPVRAKPLRWRGGGYVLGFEPVDMLGTT